MMHIQGESWLTHSARNSLFMCPGTLVDHLSSASHKLSVQVEHTQWVSQIHKLSEQKDAA